MREKDACVENKLGTATDDGVLMQYYAFEQYPTVARPFEYFTSTDCNDVEPSDGKSVLGTLAMIEDILRPSIPTPKPYEKYMAEVDSCYDSSTSMIDNLICANNSKIEAVRNGSAATPQNIAERWDPRLDRKALIIEDEGIPSGKSKLAGFSFQFYSPFL